ncbi:hypothetical protein DH2020_024298 [Rehmannia glutinosa]|uniref:Uncharacterized protein n=1 Tax=Rehmannia glutinosa TaxID=99300 RepID=A0ABR0W5A3_REHGL
MEGVFKNSENGLLEFFKREMGFCSPRIFSRRVSSSEVRLSQLLDNGSVETKRLSKHQGRVHSLLSNRESPYVFFIVAGRMDLSNTWLSIS